MREIEQVINALRNNKAPGLDSLPAELEKYGGYQIRDRLHCLFVEIWKLGKVPINIFKTYFPRISSDFLKTHQGYLQFISQAKK